MEIKGTKDKKQKRIKCWLCKKEGHFIKDCKFNTLTSSSKVKIETCTQERDENPNELFPIKRISSTYLRLFPKFYRVQKCVLK